MEKRRKNLAYYWEFMDIALVIYLVYLLINFFFPLTNVLGTTISVVVSLAVMIFVFGLVGYEVSRAGDDSHAKAGAWAGAIAGFAAAAFSIAAYYIFPGRFAATIQKAVAAGANASTVTLITQVSLFAGLIIDALIYAAIGALIAWIAKFIFKKKHSERHEEPEPKKPVRKTSVRKKK